MRNSGLSLAAFLLVPAIASAQTDHAGLKASVAEKIHTERTINGVVLTDDYAWLRQRDNPKVRAYLEAENAYAEQFTADEKPFAEALYKETLSHIKQTDESVPYRWHGYWYYSRTEEGKQYPVWCRKKGSLSAPEEVMLDVNQLAVGEKFLSLGAFEVGADSNMRAITTENGGFRQYKFHVKDLRTGKMFPDTAERVDSSTWAAD